MGHGEETRWQIDGARSQSVENCYADVWAVNLTKYYFSKSFDVLGVFFQLSWILNFLLFSHFKKMWTFVPNFAFVILCPFT